MKPLLAACVGLVAGMACSASLGLWSTRHLASAHHLSRALDRSARAERKLAALSSAHDELRTALGECRERSSTKQPNHPARAPLPSENTRAAGRWDRTPDNERVHTVLSELANPQKEVMIALANDVMMCSNRKTCWWNGGNVLSTFLKSTTRLHMRNVLIITLDDATESFCQSFGGVRSLRLELPVPEAQHNSRGANMISTLKYAAEGCATLSISILSHKRGLDINSDPFDHLYRDADVEASTDGFTSAWAHGSINSVHEPKMGWGAGGLYVQHFTLNVGCAFFRPTARAIDLMQRVADSLSLKPGWDQQVFNSEAFMLSHGTYNEFAMNEIMSHAHGVVAAQSVQAAARTVGCAATIFLSLAIQLTPPNAEGKLKDSGSSFGRRTNAREMDNNVDSDEDEESDEVVEAVETLMTHGWVKVQLVVLLVLAAAPRVGPVKLQSVVLLVLAAAPRVGPVKLLLVLLLALAVALRVGPQDAIG
ncbi:MAG: hypothetical protein SGPRY_001291 [Prymnesium sp.]